MISLLVLNYLKGNKYGRRLQVYLIMTVAMQNEATFQSL